MGMGSDIYQFDCLFTKILKLFKSSIALSQILVGCSPSGELIFPPTAIIKLSFFINT